MKMKYSELQIGFTAQINIHLNSIKTKKESDFLREHTYFYLKDLFLK